MNASSCLAQPSPVVFRSAFLRRLTLLLLVAVALALPCFAAGVRPVGSTEAPGERSAALEGRTVWCFTTSDSLTIDLQEDSAHPVSIDKIHVSLRRLGGADAGTTPARALRPAPENVRRPQGLGVVRIVFPSLEVVAWEPGAPVLYEVDIVLDASPSGGEQRWRRRVGFRSVATSDGRILFNGRPLFLRGLAINPPGRGLPEELERSRAFAEDYVRFLLRQNVNIIRIPDDDTWYDVCDELGMLVFGGNYAGSAGGRESAAAPSSGAAPNDDVADSPSPAAAQAPVEDVSTRRPPTNLDRAARWFRETKFQPYVHHPSLVIYALTNEVPYAGAAGAAWDRALAGLYERLRAWDATRLYIANAGYGLGRTGDLCDAHRYWGWYYNSPHTFLHLRDYAGLTLPDKVMPLTFTECVGNYGGPDGRVNLTPNHKNPISQQCWTGHAPVAEQAQLFAAHQSLVTRQATELFRRLRPLNPELSGVFPFTILFYNWHTVSAFDEMIPRPAARQLRASYQPVLLSWELYTTQVYAGSALHPICHVVNDATDGSELRAATVRWELRDAAAAALVSGSTVLDRVPYYGTTRRPLEIALPDALPSGTYTLWGGIDVDGKRLSENSVEIFIASHSFARTGRRPAPVRLFDPSGNTRAAFQKLGLPFTAQDADSLLPETLPLGVPIVIGEEAVGALPGPVAARLAASVREGRRVLVLRAAPEQVDAVNRLLPCAVNLPSADLDNPAYPPPPRPARQGFNINPERPDHPVFSGIDRRRLQAWSDYSGWDESKPGLPRIHPVTGTFVVRDKSEHRSIAVLANHSVGLEGLALAEFHAGAGSIAFCAFDLVARAGIDPVADRLFANLLAWLSQPRESDPYVCIEAPIVWGYYETERGVLTGIVSGLMLNGKPALTGPYRDARVTLHKDGHQLALGGGGFNTRPGLQYMPVGRRFFGPYEHGSWSGTPRPAATPEGEARFWCRVPPGRTKVVHRLWNPAASELTVHASANGREASAAIPAGGLFILELPLQPGATVVENRFRGDRRLVLLETSFEGASSP